MALTHRATRYLLSANWWKVRWFTDFRLCACQRDLRGLPIRWTPELRVRVDATRRRAELIFGSSGIKAVDK